MLNMVVLTLNPKEFGLQFSRIRESSGFRSQRELADVSGVSHSTINRIESGSHKTHPEIFKKLAPYLKGVTYEGLMEMAGYLETTSAQNNDELMYDPDVQFIARSKKEMTPEAFRRLMELTKMAKDMVVNEHGKKKEE
jgi:transcriptional regulator with XRE-family HTH domain